MSGYAILIILLVLCMMLGPLFMIRPSPYQKNIAKMRDEARKLGLKVSMTNIDEVSRVSYDLPWSLREGEKYALENYVLEKKPYEHEIHIAKYWEWNGKTPSSQLFINIIEEQLSTVLKTVDRVEVNKLGLRCYWKETNTNDLNRLREWMETTANRLLPYIHRSESILD